MASDAASVSSQSTEASFVKPPLPLTTTAETNKVPRRRLRNRIKTVLSDVGAPPTTRHDKAHGIETPKYVDLGMIRPAPMGRT